MEKNVNLTKLLHFLPLNAWQVIQRIKQVLKPSYVKGIVGYGLNS